MTSLRIILEGDGATKDIAGQLDDFDRTREPRAMLLKGGMQSGKHSIGIAIPTIGGRWLLFETSADLFITAARAFAIRIAINASAQVPVHEAFQQMQRENAELQAEALEVAAAMKKYGGNFVEKLADAIEAADMSNQQTLRAAFAEYWQKYADVARRERHDPTSQGGAAD